MARLGGQHTTGASSIAPSHGAEIKVHTMTLNFLLES